MNRKGYTLVEMMTVLGIFVFVSAGLLGTMVVVRNTFFRSSTQIDLQQNARYGMARMVNEIAQTGSGKVTIYKCPAGICMGGAITFQVPVVDNDPITGSIYEPRIGATNPIKWGYDGLQTNDTSNEKIIYMVPEPTGPFGAFANQLVRITRKTNFCPNNYCDPGETHALCPADCLVLLNDIWLRRLFGEGVAYGQAVLPAPPDISLYNNLPSLGVPSSYIVQVIASDVSAVYFLGNPGPGSGGNAESKPNIVQIFLEMSKPTLFQGQTLWTLSTRVLLRNLSN